MEGTKQEIKDFLKKWLESGTHCTIQHDGWTCRTCFYDMMDRLKIPDELQQGFWEFILSTRGDYDNFDWNGVKHK